MATLDGPRAKLDRAEYHLDALSKDVRERPDRKSHAVRGEFDEADQLFTGFLEEVGELPRVFWGLLLGDFVTNLRAALDHLVCQLVLLSGGSIHVRHQFPIVESDTEFDGVTVKGPNAPKNWKGQLDFVDPSQVAMIKGLQPNKPTMGVPSLKMLRRFSNDARHQLIHSLVVFTDETPAVQISVNGVLIPLLAATWVVPPLTPVGAGTKILEVRPDPRFIPTTPNRQVNVHVNLPLVTMFGEPGHEDTRIADFRSCLGDIRKIVEGFAPFFP